MVPQRTLCGCSSRALSIFCYDARIIGEYREVLARPKFAFTAREIGVIIDYIEQSGHAVAAAPFAAPLRDRGDEPLFEVAITGRTNYLITGNIAHYPSSLRAGVRVVNPAQSLSL